MNVGTRRISAVIGVLMVIAMGSSAILPLLTPNNQTLLQPTTVPTAVPVPTFPSPISDLNTITFDESYLQPSGLFTIAVPSGWTASPIAVNPNTPSTVEVSMNNSEAVSVIQASVQVPDAAVTTLDELDARFTSEVLRQSWTRYTSWRETKRERQDDKLLIDFELDLRGQTFVARQVSWSDNEWIYSLRVIMPENATDTLKYLVDNLLPTFKGNKVFAGTPTEWSAYFDAETDSIIRFPATWTLADSAPGRPATITAKDVSLRLETVAETSAADEAAARAWVESARAGANILSVNEVTRGDSSGFSVAYTYTNVDGDTESGLAILLNGADEALHVANLRLFQPGVDLNSDDGKASYPEVAAALNTFTVLTGIQVVQPTVEPTPAS